MEFDLSSATRGCRLRWRENGGSFRRSFGDIRGGFFVFLPFDSSCWKARGGPSRQTGGPRNDPRAGQSYFKTSIRNNGL
jgi:hypothetical protein